jgi:hypothetical protein
MHNQMPNVTDETKRKVWKLAEEALSAYAKSNPNMSGDNLESSQRVVYAFMLDAVVHNGYTINPIGEDEQNLCDSCLPAELRLANRN